METVTAVYDLAVSPPTYDFFTFLVEAERFRLSKQADRVDIVFQPGPVFGFRQDNLPPGPVERASMFQRVCIAGARLLPSVSDVVAFGQRTNIQADFPVGYKPFQPISHYGACYQVNGLRCLQATAAAKNEIKERFKRPYVTITLRQSKYWPGRNSNIEAWTAASLWFESKGLQPVIIPDTHGESFGHFQSFNPASWDIDLRLALYERAVLNVGVATGPMSLCILSDCPYIMFKIVSKDNAPAHKVEFLKSHGLNEGENFSINGKSVWDEDTEEIVLRELDLWFSERARKVG